MTKLLYLEDFDVTEASAKVVRVEEFEGKDVVVLDQTCFYPKGGGQDFDTGTLSYPGGSMTVEAVFFVDGEVKHIGTIDGDTPSSETEVQCSVDTDRRALNTKLHSAGHVIDMAVSKLALEWVPAKGAHYPHMSFVEYSIEGGLENKDASQALLQEKINELLQAGSTNAISFMTPEEMLQQGAHVPANIPKDKPARAMIYDDFPVPCGGTHVRNIHDIGAVTITKIKNRKPDWRISYHIS